MDSVKETVNKIRKDGWLNVLKGIGGAKDASNKTSFGDFRMIPDEEIAAMLLGDGWVSKICNIPAGTMTKEWVSISDDADNTIGEKLKVLNTKNVFRQAIVWQRAFRGSLVWMISAKKSGAEYKEGEKIDIKKLLVFSASEVRVHERYSYDNEVMAGSTKTTKTTDPLKIGTVKSFCILKNVSRPQDIIVSASQCLCFKGEMVPAVPGAGFDAMVQTGTVPTSEYLFWGTGAIQSVYSQLAKYGAFEQGMGQIGLELVVAVYKLAGLRDMLQSEDGAAAIQTRLQVIEKAKGMINGVFLDAEGDEDLIRTTINLAGVPDLWDRFMMTLSGVSNIPASLLFGRQATGLNNKGEQDRDNYNGWITMEQEKDMDSNIQILLSHLEGAQIPFTFNRLDTPTQEEDQNMRESQAKIDEIYLDKQVVMPEEVRTSRFKSTYSYETQLAVKYAPEDLEGDDDLPTYEDDEEDSTEDDK